MYFDTVFDYFLQIGRIFLYALIWIVAFIGYYYLRKARSKFPQ